MTSAQIYLRIIADLCALAFIGYIIYKYKKYGIERVESLRKKLAVIGMLSSFIGFATADDSVDPVPIYMTILIPLCIGSTYFFNRWFYDKAQEDMELPISYPAFQLCFLLLLLFWNSMIIGSIIEDHIFLIEHK
jgi:hypothetical protein